MDSPLLVPGEIGAKYDTRRKPPVPSKALRETIAGMVKVQLVRRVLHGGGLYKELGLVT